MGFHNGAAELIVRVECIRYVYRSERCRSRATRGECSPLMPIPRPQYLLPLLEKKTHFIYTVVDKYYNLVLV